MNAFRSLVFSLGSVVLSALIIGCTHTIDPPNFRDDEFSPGLSLVMTPDRVLDGYLLGVGLFHQQPDLAIKSVVDGVLTFNGERHTLDREVPFRRQPRWCYSGEGDIEVVLIVNGESYAYTIEYPTATNDVIPATVSTSNGATISLSPALRGDERVVVLVTGVKNGFRDIIGEFTFNDAGRSTIVLTPSQIATFSTNADDLYCIVERRRTQSLGDTFPAGGSLTILYKRAERTWTVTE